MKQTKQTYIMKKIILSFALVAFMAIGTSAQTANATTEAPKTEKKCAKSGTKSCCKKKAATNGTASTTTETKSCCKKKSKKSCAKKEETSSN